LVYETGRPARVDDFSEVAGKAPAVARAHGLHSAVGFPIIVDGKVWGVLGIAARQGETPPADVEQHLAAFTELVSTAIANSDARDQVSRLLDEQSALRRVATLVAVRATAEEVHLSVAREVANVFDVSLVTVCRYDPDALVVLASLGAPQFPVGSSWPLDGPSLPATILETGRAARIDDYSNATGLDAVAREGGVRASVGAPIIVDGAVWGCVNLATREEEPLPADAEARLARFTGLVATAVSNATMRADLIASRARVVATADETRRRIERDLHDGAQSQLVTLALGLRATEGRLPAGMDDLKAEVAHVADRLTGVIEELREMSRGIHPAILTEGGLSPALEALALRSAVPVKLNVCCEHRLSDKIEVAAYYVTSEALTNAAKHAGASHVRVNLRAEEDALRLSIRDDGVGGANASGGSGLVGIKDRIEALGGTIEVKSPPGDGTQLDVEIPLIPDPSAQPDATAVA
jgi:signal transduction histidine kinase